MLNCNPMISSINSHWFYTFHKCGNVSTTKCVYVGLFIVLHVLFSAASFCIHWQKVVINTYFMDLVLLCTTNILYVFFLFVDVFRFVRSSWHRKHIQFTPTRKCISDQPIHPYTIRIWQATLCVVVTPNDCFVSVVVCTNCKCVFKTRLVIV